MRAPNTDGHAVRFLAGLVVTLSAAAYGGSCSLFEHDYDCSAERPCPAGSASGSSAGTGGEGRQVGVGEGRLALTCPAGELECDGRCVDIERDPRRCGACDARCAPGQRCDHGECTCVGGVVRNLGSRVPQTVEGSTAGEEDSYAPACVGGAARDEVFLFTAAEAGSYTAQIVAATYDAAVVMLAASGCDEIACGDEAPVWPAKASVELSPGESVYIVVSGRGGAQGEFTLGLSLQAPCAPVELGSTVPQTVEGTTAGRADAIVPSCGRAGAPDATYRFTAPADGIYSFDASRSSVATVLEVLGSACSGPSFGCTAGASGPSSPLLAHLEANEPVVVAVEGVEASGDFRLDIGAVPFGECNAVVLPSEAPQTVTGTTGDLARRLVPPCSARGGREAVYAFTAPETGLYVFDTAGSQGSPTLYVLNGGCDGATLACNDGAVTASPSKVQLLLAARQTVAVVLDSFDDAQREYTLTIGREPR